jgi:hypothetical protein
MVSLFSFGKVGFLGPKNSKAHYGKWEDRFCRTDSALGVKKKKIRKKEIEQENESWGAIKAGRNRRDGRLNSLVNSSLQRNFCSRSIKKMKLLW